MRFFEELKIAANDVNLELSEKQYEQFIKYMRLVQEWNEKINLTAITEDEEFIKKHFVDCIKAFKSKAIAEAHNVTTIHSRAEDGARNPELRENFDVATSRAVANMAVLSEFCMTKKKKNGHFVALKGPAIEEELENGKAAIKILGGELKNIIEVSIEGTDLRHNIVEVLKVRECNKKYPRKAGTVNKNPLK